MTAAVDRFHRTLEDAVENELSAQSETLARSIVATLWNACDDERGRLAEENRRLRAEVAELRTKLATAERQARELDQTVAERDEQIAGLLADIPTDDYDEAAAPR